MAIVLVSALQVGIAAHVDEDVDSRKRAWLEAFEESGTVVGACKSTGMPRSTAYLWRTKDEAFLLAWHDIEEATTERMEREAYRRGVEGVQRDVYHMGRVVGAERQYSDVLLIFMLKARRPERYRDNVKVEQDIKVTTSDALVSDPELAKEARGLLRRAASAGGDVAGRAGGRDQ